MIEIEYFIALCELPLPQLKGVKQDSFNAIRDIYINFKDKDIAEIKGIEATTNHDVKAVEYFLKNRFEELKLGAYKEFIHFGLTSQDINNTAVPLTIRLAYKDAIKPGIAELLHKIEVLSKEWKDIVMLAHTHGQPASPTTAGKELFVFAERLRKQINMLDTIPFSAKFGGATGNFNAHHAAYPDIDWIGFADKFVNNILKLDRSKTTTQIEHYDNFAAFCDNLKRINNILIDLNRDVWMYISMDYFKQKIKAGEVGSSAMPHKVNPIDFENSEGNLGYANAILEHLSAKLPVSRLQRDLTDSTVLRNIGVPIGHSLIAYKSLLRGLDKLLINEPVIKEDLNSNWAVIAEGIQTILRREGYKEPYEALKELTRNNTVIEKAAIHRFIDGLKVNNEVKEELKRITPENYRGIIKF
jgi:adenylosuccinate lyase